MESAFRPDDTDPDQIASPASRKKCCDRYRRDLGIRSWCRLAPAGVAEQKRNFSARSVWSKASPVSKRNLQGKPRPAAVGAGERPPGERSRSGLASPHPGAAEANLIAPRSVHWQNL